MKLISGVTPLHSDRAPFYPQQPGVNAAHVSGCTFLLRFLFAEDSQRRKCPKKARSVCLSDLSLPFLWSPPPFCPCKLGSFFQVSGSGDGNVDGQRGHEERNCGTFNKGQRSHRGVVQAGGPVQGPEPF